MRSGVMMILKIARQHAAQVTLAEDNDVIQAFTTDRPDETLDIWVLPGRGGNCAGRYRSNATSERTCSVYLPVGSQMLYVVQGTSWEHFFASPCRCF